MPGTVNFQITRRLRIQEEIKLPTANLLSILYLFMFYCKFYIFFAVTLFGLNLYLLSLCMVVIIITLTYSLIYLWYIVLLFWLSNKNLCERPDLEFRWTSEDSINHNIDSWQTTLCCVNPILFCCWWTTRCVITVTINYQVTRIFIVWEEIKLPRPNLFFSLFLFLFYRKVFPFSPLLPSFISISIE